MHISKVILEGFKSYGERTVVGPLHQGHNVVVGRNGSGKSNFFSAIEFVLLADSSNLKAEQQKALLHEGSGPRPITASVEIVFDNKDRRFPLDCDEVSVRRVVGLKKDQLFLNGKAATSKTEIRSNLEAAGFSCSNPYYVVRQGQINKIACCSSKARLALVKEVAGLSIYQENRTKSEEELRRTEVEIREAEASLVHVQERLEQLSEEKQALEELKKMEKEKKGIEAAMLETELKEGKEKLKKGEMVLSQVESSGNKKALAEVVKSSFENKETVRSLEAKVVACELELSHQNQQSERLEKRKAALRLQKVDLKEEIEAAQVSSGGGDKLERLKQNLSKVEKSMLEVSDELEEKEKKLTEVTQERDGVYKRLGRSKQFNSVEARDQWIEEEMKKIKEKMKEKEHLAEEVERRVKETKKSLREVEVFEDGREENEQRIRDDAHGQLTQLTREKAECRRQFHELCNQGVQLQHQLQVEEESSKGVLNRLRWMQNMKQVLQERNTINKVLEEVPRLRVGYHGLVVDNFTCPEGLITAVEQTAGGKLFYHVVDSDKVATEILKEVNKRKLPGVLTFLALNRIKPKQRQALHDDQTKNAFPIMDKIECEKELNKVMEFVFNGSLVCRNMETAVQMARVTRRDCITLEGDKSSCKGVLAGGYLDKEKSRLGGWVKYRGACEKVQELKDQLTQLGVQREVVFESESRATEQIEEVHRRIRQMEAEVSEMEERLRTRGTSMELRSLVRRDEEQLGCLRREWRSLENCVEELKSEIGVEMNSQITQEEKERCERLTREIECAKKEFKVAHEKKVALEAEYLDVSGKLKRADEELTAEKLKRKSKEKAEKALQLLEIELEEVEGSLLKEKKVQMKIQERGGEAAEELSKTKKALEDLEREEKRLNGIVFKEQAEIHKLLESAVRLRMNYTELVNKRDALGGVSPDLIQKYKGKGRKELGKLLEKVLAKIKKHRGVNQKADDQFATFTKEEEKFSRRRDDLVATKAEVQNTLNMLDHRKSEQILYTYRQLYRNFATVFKELVPAGQGEVLLTGDFEAESDGQQLEVATGLSTSVTFAGDAEPRRNMEQLSGGQKTLVALAFILAIQRCDPAPFYLFDEVDAALDADYRESVARVIHQQSSSAQFVTTTFRAELLKDADRHFGVFYRGKASQVMVVEREEAKDFVEQE